MEPNAMQPNVMNTPARLAAAAGGALLLVAPFLPWAEAGGSSAAGWDVASGVSLLALVAGVTAMTAAVTGGRIGFFRPDLSLNGAADILGVVSTVVIVWQLFDLPAGASPAWGIYVAVAGAVAVMGSFGDYRTLRGAPAFPRLGNR